MTYLNEYLGHILAEITRARVQADLESIKAAKLYAADEEGLLKNFSVPRMRLPNIEITLPIVINEVPDGDIEKTDPAALSRSIVASVQDILAKNKVSLDTAQIYGMIQGDKLLQKGFITEDSINALSNSVADKVKAPTTKSVNTKVTSEQTHKEMVTFVRDKLTEAIKSLPKKAIGISIDPKTSVIKEMNGAAGQATNVVYIKLMISEEALEINYKEQPETTNAAGEVVKTPLAIQRLTPE